MNNSISKAASILALAILVSVIGPDHAMAKEKKQTSVSSKSSRTRSSGRSASNSLSFKEAWAEVRSNPPSRFRSSVQRSSGPRSAFNQSESLSSNIQRSSGPRATFNQAETLSSNAQRSTGGSASGQTTVISSTRRSNALVP